MHLFILGCGTIVQQDTSINCSGYLLNDSLLFDCGPGIWKACHHHKISLHQIKHIFLTHFHVDHTSDLGPLLLNRMLLPNLKDSPLNIIGPPGLKEWFLDLKKLLGGWSNDISVILHEMGEEPYQMNEMSVTARSTGHTENSICYRVERDEESFFYSGDTGYNENVISLASDCRLAVIEASNTEQTHIAEHLTPQLAGKISTRASVRKLVLTHMYPEVLKNDPIREASSVYSGEIILAREGMLIEF